MNYLDTYQIEGKSYTLKRYANVDDTINHIKRIIDTHYHTVAELADNLQAQNEAQIFKNIWDFVRNNIQYQNDAKGKEQLRRPQRSLHDKIGDCDDFSILISSILLNLNIEHELIVAAYKKENNWQHIYPVAYDSHGKRYVIDCVPEIPHFNYEAGPIKSQIIIPIYQNMKLEELGQLADANQHTSIMELTEPFNLEGLGMFDSEEEEIAEIQGLLGNVAIVDEDEAYDSVLSGSELHKNLILRQLTDAKATLEKELSNPTELSQISDVKQDLRLISDLIESFDDEDEIHQVLQEAIAANTIYQNFYKTIQFALEEALNGLAGEEDDELFYLKVMDQEGMLDQIIADDDLEGLGRIKLFSKLKNKIKKGVQKLKKKFPKLAKIGHAFKKYNPATFALRKSLELFLRGNVFKIGSKIALGYATESKAKSLGYSASEWKQFVAGKDKAESRWYALGGKKEYFKKMILGSRGAKDAGLRGLDGTELGVAPAVIAAVSKAFGALLNFFKGLKLKKEKQNQEAAKQSMATSYSQADFPQKKSITNNQEQMSTDEKSGVTQEKVTDENGKETTIYRDKEGNEISKTKAFFLKHKKMIIIISIVLVVGIIALIIWKVRQRSLNGLGSAGLSRKQENYIRRQGLNNRSYASLVREEIHRDGKKNTKSNRKIYYKKVFRDAFSRPITQKQVTATLNHNDRLKRVRTLAKQYGGGSDGWRRAWAEVKGAS
jgi:hypothetical protein